VISISFLHLKKHLAGQKFHKDKEMKNEITSWLLVQAVKFYDTGIQKLKPWLNKCLDESGDYGEKYLKACVKRGFFHSILLISIIKKCY
jgi:hypothetical protein